MPKVRNALLCPYLALCNLRSNRRDYLPFLGAASLIVCLFFTVCNISESRSFARAIPGSGTLHGLMTVATLLLPVVCGPFLWYINSFLMKRRRRELGLYGVLGLERRHVGAVLLFETLYSLAISLVVGLGAGLLLMGLSAGLLLRLAGITADYTPQVAPGALAITAGLFGVIFLGCLAGSFAHLSLATPTELLREDHAGEKDPRFGVIGCILGVALLGGGYTVAIRGNLSFTSVNLPRLAIKSKGNIELFFEQLDRVIDVVIAQLLERFKIQCKKKVKNYPFLMGQGIWLGSDKLGYEDEVGEVLKQGTLTCGFIGLAECLKSLIGKHHGESEEAQNLGLEIIGHMRKRMDDAADQYNLNFSLIATPAEGLSGRFVRIDRKKYGKIEGVTDREYYTNSFHIPVYFPISAFEKIRLEAPYHELTNGGHISYIELDGDPTQNLEAFEQVVRYMKECGVGYGSINHPVDRDPVCGYTGIIGDVCPRCGRREGEGVSIAKLKKLGLYKNLNAGTIGYHGDPFEEKDRHPNKV